MELSYTRHGDYLLPDLILAEQPYIGKYGMLRKTFLKRHRPATSTALLMSGELSKHLADIDHLAHEQIQLLLERMAKAQDVTEALKANDSMEWTAQMNNIRSCAEEVVLAEVIYE
ncbi:MAG: TnpV protein [Clostridiales bacterium]|nr:TnpV protein [Clostridiales bacterium]